MISDETLILYYYDDGLGETERSEVRRALERDDALATRYRDLTASLDSLAGSTPPAAPPDAVVRWRYELDEAVAAGRRRPWSPALFVSAAALLALGIAIGAWLGGDAQDPAPAARTAPPVATGNPPPPALTRGVAQYLRDSRLQLVGLQGSDQEGRVELITAIIEQNRLFERAAERNDSPELARVLRAFEQMLRELARQEATPAEIDRTSDRLAFEYAVMLTKLSRDTSPPSTSL